MKGQHLIIIIVIGLLGFSCKKFGNGYVEGTVYESITNNAVPGATISLFKNYHNNTSSLIGSTISDATGKYKISYHKKQGYNYFITCYNPNQFYDGDEFPLTYKKTNTDIFIDPLAFLKVRIKNNSNSPQYVDLWIGQNGTTKTPVINNGVDTILSDVFKVNGNGRTSVGWMVYASPFTYHADEIFIYNKGDTATFLIQF